MSTQRLGVIFLLLTKILLNSESNTIHIQDTTWPKNIRISKIKYEDWTQTTVIPKILLATPTSAEETLLVVNWAHENGFKIRASGSRHSWVPLTVSNDDNPSQIILINIKDSLNKTKLLSNNSDYADIRSETGVQLEDLLAFMESNGCGFTANPTAGSLTVGGMLAVGGHGHGIPARGEKQLPGAGYGSMSNHIVSLRAIVWDYSKSKYVLETFGRTHPNASAFLTNLARTFLTDVTFRVGVYQNLRCESFTDIPFDEFFSDDPGKRTVTKLMDETGRAEIFIIPFAKFPWIKRFTVSKEKPSTSRHVTSPYNFDLPPTPELIEFKTRLSSGDWSVTPDYASAYFSAIERGLVTISSKDIWGTPKNVLLCFSKDFERVLFAGFTVLTKRDNIAKILNKSHKLYQNLTDSFRSKNKFPMNSFVNFRVSGLDNPKDVLVPGAKAPYLSTLQPLEAFPDFDVAIWYTFMTLTNTPHAFEFYAEIESLFADNFKPPDAVFRYEWAKGWAFTGDSAWHNRDIFNKIKNTFPDWETARSIFKYYDPNNVFYNKMEKFLFDD